MIPLQPAAAAPHGTGPVSAWVARWQALLPPGGRALDLACGAGRHVAWLAAQGLQVTAVDRDPAALQALRQLAVEHPGRIEVLAADLEGASWPLPGQQFDLVLVTNYLWRPLLPTIATSVAPGGLLIYETFALGQEQLGRPRNPDFLLRRGELLDVAAQAGLQVLGFETGRLDAPVRIVQRLVARRARPDEAGDAPALTLLPS
ncbi:MAG: hypothetical protein RJA44_2204 [Pseudomonadota bacterium]|jgi:SAM-dependent methyltransferase